MLFDKMKKAVALSLSVCTLLGFSVSAEEKSYDVYPNAVQISINGSYIDAPNFFSENGVYAPLRAITEGFGYEVVWNEDRSIDLTFEKTQEPNFKPLAFQSPKTAPAVISAYADELTIWVNGEEISTPHFLYNNTTYVPVSFFQDVMNGYVFEDFSLGMVKIYSPDYVTFTPEDAFYYDGQMLNNEQYQDAVKFLANAMGGANVTSDIAARELTYFKAAYLMGEQISGDKNFQAFLEQNKLDALMEQLGISDKEVFRDTFLKAVYYQYSVTDETALAYYTPTEDDFAAQLAKSPYGNGHWMKAKHILISQTDGDGDLKQAEAILKQLQTNPKKFDELMNEYSQDPGSKTYPDGYLFTEGQMVTEFYEGTLPLEEGEISDIVESQYGYHIILKVADYPDGVPYTEVQNELHLAYAQEQFTAEWNNALANVNLVPNQAPEQ